MRERHLFAGVNSPAGFFSRFENIMPERPGARKIFIKGGPGMGKSTLMKKIAKKAAEAELECEVFHCSSDPDSVDGVHIPALSTAIVDATAPHESDPRYIGMGGEIFDVSAFLQKEKLSAEPEKMTALVETKKRAFEKGYRFLEAALPLLGQIESERAPYADMDGIALAAEKLAESVLGSGRGPRGGERPLFLSAIGPEGFVHFGDTIFSGTYCVAVKGSFGTDYFVRRFAELARARGFTPTTLYCPMRPEEKMEHLYIRELQFSLTSYNFYTRILANEVLDLDAYMAPRPEEDGEAFRLSLSLMQRAADAFSEARKAHGDLEKVYGPCMDFAALEEKTAVLLQSIF